MKYLSYLDFELKIEKQGDHYTACVIQSPARQADGTFKLPFSKRKLDRLIVKLGKYRKLSQIPFIKEDPAQGEAAREIGATLFNAVFSGNVLKCYRESLKHVYPDKGLRLKLMLHNASELADIPWEFLFDAINNSFLAQSPRTLLVRYISLPEIHPFSVTLPLQILIASSSPPDCDKLDVEIELSRLEKALAPLIQEKKVNIEKLKLTTFETIQKILWKKDFHIFHFIGHGEFDAQTQKGLLVMENEDGQKVKLNSDRITALLGDHFSLRLVVLNCCESARFSIEEGPFSGVATALIQRGIPAVVAMQFPISDKAAIKFAGMFYEALVNGFPADAAMAEARKAVFGMPNDAEWGTPVLYMRSADGVLFRFEQEHGEKSDFNKGVTAILKEGESQLFDNISAIKPIREAEESELPDIEFELDLSLESEFEKDERPLIEVVSPKIEQLKRFTNSIGMKFVYIPPGEFMMGSPEDEPGRYKDETLHRVILTRGFYMQTTPVTQGQWKAVMGKNPSWFKDCGDNCPVENVSYKHVQKFIKKLNQSIYSSLLPVNEQLQAADEGLPVVDERSRTYRLPTEAEWEYACRAGTDTAYYFGNDPERLEEYAWFHKNSGGIIHSVAQIKPNAWGLYDIHGNVWEWCQDWYDDYFSGTATNPMGSSSGSAARVLRGGSWYNTYATHCRSAVRYRYLPDDRHNNIGFRLILSSDQKSEDKLSKDERLVIEIASPKIEEPKRLTKIEVVTPKIEEPKRLTKIEVVTPKIKQIEQPDRLTNSLGMEFVWIPPGEFMMGSPEDEPGRYKDETLHRVILTRGFYMQITQVTVGQWRAFVKNTGFRSQAETGGGAYGWTGSEWKIYKKYYWDNLGFSQTDTHPVTCISWNDVQEFIKKLNQAENKEYRLPTEAEWEYACRAATDTPFYFGKCLSTDEANYNGNYPMEGCPKGIYRGKTTPVKTFPLNAWGLYDMHGNVWEWCHDWYGDYPTASVTDPMGPDSGSGLVLRGGGWSSFARYCRSAYRDWVLPDYRNYVLGLRLLLPPSQQG